MAASVLFLIPGVPFINGAADLFSTHYLNGMVRIMMGIIFVIGIATGVTTVIDAGSTGADDVDDFYQLTRQAATDVYARSISPASG